MKNRIYLILGIIISLVIVIGMSSRIVLNEKVDSSFQVSSEEIIRNYNEMNYRWIVSNYFEKGSYLLGFTNKPEILYICAVSLYRLSNYSEVLNFTNFYFDQVLSNNVLLLVGFSLSELGEFELSERFIRTFLTNSFYHYSDLIEYYRFRNNLYLGKEYIPSVSISGFLKSEDIGRVISNLGTFSDSFAVFVSRELSGFRKNELSKDVVLSLLNRKYSQNYSIISVGRNLIKAGFNSDGVRLILTASLPSVVRDYYRAFLMVENKQFENARSLILSLINGYEKQKEVLRDYGISFDDLLILNLRLYSNTSSKEFNEVVKRYLRLGGSKFLEYVLRNNRILSGDIYLSAVTNYFSKVDLNYSTKTFYNSFVSFNIHEGNFEYVKRFSDYMLKRTKNTAWEKEFLFLNFLFETSYQRKLDLAKTIILNYPFTYEYISIINYLGNNQTFLNDIVSELLSEYYRIFARYSTNSTIKDLNTMIGIKFLTGYFGIVLTNDFDIFQEVSRFRKQLVPLYISALTNTNLSNTNDIETNEIRILRNYPHIRYLVSRGLILDLHLEVRKLMPRPNYQYVDDYRNYGMIDYVCRAYERLGMHRDNIHSNRAVVVLSFLKELYPTPFEDKVEMYSTKYSVNKALVYSIMRQESKYSPYVTSIANAMGLMQLILSTADATARRFWNTKEPLNRLDVYNIDNNIHLGIAHINELIQAFSRYPQNFQEILVISSYNAGMTAVRRWYDSLKTDNEMLFVEAIRFHETKEYTKIVIENKFIYQNFVFTDDNIAMRNKK